MNQKDEQAFMIGIGVFCYISFIALVMAEMRSWEVVKGAVFISWIILLTSLGVLIYLKKNLNKQLGGENNGNV